jgi:hypothetical protein
MILGYRDARTERFAHGERIKAFEPLRHQAENRLIRLEIAKSRKSWRPCAATGWRNCPVTARDNGACGSMISGASASSGRRVRRDRMMLKLWIIIEV